MKYVLSVFLILFSTSLFASTPITTEVLALKLWNTLDKAQNVSYTTLDNYRLKLDKDDQARKTLSDPQEFKRIQTVIRNSFVERVSKEFSRKEILNLIKIYQRPEVEKLRLFSMDFWDDKTIKEILDRDILFNTIK
ncbi:MAG: hypothetical protein K0R29_1945 [Pseudobdellovibrio sp.]|jgi:hypothetical protein|nr:hypothetical protein [Pseudobdellovibrio sp.]